MELSVGLGTIPAEKAILLPILNHGGTLADSPSINSAEELLSYATAEMDIVSNVEVSVDDCQNNRFRETSYKITDL